MVSVLWGLYGTGSPQEGIWDTNVPRLVCPQSPLPDCYLEPLPWAAPSAFPGTGRPVGAPGGPPTLACFLLPFGQSFLPFKKNLLPLAADLSWNAF